MSPKSEHLSQLLLVLDVLLSVWAYLLAMNIALITGSFGSGGFIKHLGLLPIILLINVICFDRARLGLVRGLSYGYIFRGFQSLALALGSIFSVVFVLDLTFVSRLVIGVYALGTVATVLASRLFLSWWYLIARREKEENYTKVLVIGSGPRAERILKERMDRSEWGIRVVDVLDPVPERVGDTVFGLEVTGTLDEIEEALTRQVVEEVIIATPRSLLSTLEPVVRACEEQAIPMSLCVDLYEMRPANVSLGMIGTIPLVSFKPVSQSLYKLVFKRIFDLTLTLLALPILLPFFALVAAAIRLDSPGPVFYVQERVGWNKRRFSMLKFRSMFIDADERLNEIEHLNEADGPIFKMRNDPRVTRVGKVLRKSSIDELPQLLNVLLGDMSLVGPRPMSRRDVELFDKGIQRRRFSVKPGLACLREVSGRSELSFDQWLELDLQYIENWSLTLDAKILALLVPAVLLGSGAS